MPRGPMPRWIEPQFPKLVGAAPSGPDWIHEVKFDGYRMQLRVEKRSVTIRTRRGHDWTEKFPALAKAASKLPDCIVDGELCAVGEDGKPDFPALIGALNANRSGSLVFFAFDCMWRGREDLRYQPLLTRKDVLQRLVDTLDSPRIRYSTHTSGAGPAIFKAACAQHLEGVVCKRAKATYDSGKGNCWVKVKCRPAQEVVVGGWTQDGARFKALLAGVYERGKLRYIGKVGTGFSERVLSPLVTRLKAKERKASPFAGQQPRSSSAIHFVDPEIVAEIAHAGFIDGELRQASFKGVREDKPAKDVGLEA